MLAPKRIRHRKVQRGSMKGKAKGYTQLHHGEYGIQALEAHWITNRQIEAARIAMTRYMKRGGKVWITIFPDKPITQKPAETRMGSGKGNPEAWVAVVKPGRIMFEIGGVDDALPPVRPRVSLVQKLPSSARSLPRTRWLVMKVSRDYELSSDDLTVKLKEACAELFNLRFQMATSQLDNTAQ